MKRTRYLQQILASHTDVATMGKLMTRLVDCNKFAEIERLLICLPDVQEYNDNEEISRARIALAWNKKDLQTVYSLIEEGSFNDGEDLIEIWDQAHYYEAECHTAVQRYRLRQRLRPPQSICPSGLRKKRVIPKATCKALQAWFTDHNPYPTSSEKVMLAQQHGLTYGQLKNWFANARRRLRKKTTGCLKNLRQLRTQCKRKAEHLNPAEDKSEKYSPSWQLEGVKPLVNQSSLPLFPNATPWQLVHTPLDDQSGFPLFQSETPWKQENVTPLDQLSAPLSPIETPWKLVDATPSFDQSRSPKLSPNETQALSPQSFSTNHANTAPAVMWNSVFNYTAGLNPVIACAPFVAAGGQHQFPWFPNLVVFPPIPAAALELNRLFPAGLCFPGHGCWSKPFSGFDEGNFRNYKLMNFDPEVIPTSAGL